MSGPDKKAPPPKARFGAAAFGTLRATIGAENRGEPIRIALSAIDEDPNQPRRAFDAEELAVLAESIRALGVLQPIVVRPPEEGRYRLVLGARRLRASRLAGLSDIPAIIRRAEDDDFTAQVIENQQRANLSNAELAAAVSRFVAEKRTTKEIAALCNLKDYQITAFRQVDEFPAELKERLDQADIRALYDLFRQWTKTPEAVLAALPAPETYLSVTEARRILAALTGKPTGSLVLDRGGTRPRDEDGADPSGSSPSSRSADTPPDTPKPSPLVPSSGQEERATQRVGKARSPSSVAEAPVPKPPASPASAQANGAPVFFVAAADGESGRLVVDRRAERAGWVLVAYDSGLEEVEAQALRILRVE